MGNDVRHETLPLVVWQSRVSVATSSDRIPSENLVPKQGKQREEADSRGTRRSECCPRIATTNVEGSAVVPWTKDWSYFPLLAIHNTVPDLPLSITILSDLHKPRQGNSTASILMTSRRTLTAFSAYDLRNKLLTQLHNKQPSEDVQQLIPSFGLQYKSL